MQAFRTRILTLLVALVVTTQLATVAALVLFTQREALARAQRDLQAGGRVFAGIMQSRAQQLRGAVQILVADYGFKEAVTTGEQATIRSALDNSTARIKADLAVFFDNRGKVLATTAPDLTGTAGADLIRGAGEGSDVLYRPIGGQSYLLVMAPVRAPAPVGWAAIGFRIDARLAAEMRSLLGVEVTYYDRQRPQEAAFVSTLSADLVEDLHQEVVKFPAAGAPPQRLDLGGHSYVVFDQPVEGSEGRLHVILQTSLADILAAFAGLRGAILLIAALGILLALPIASLLARGASRPLDALVSAAQRIEGGNYSVPVVLHGSREFISVATTLNSMQERVGERERRILQQATHDDLTGLPNRRHFRERLEAAMRESKVTRAPLALLLLDLRELERITASFGHLFSDEVLRDTAHRLVSRVRADALVARSGTSRFLILLPGEDEARARLLAGLLIEAVRVGTIHDGVPISLGAVVGICAYPQHGDDADVLLRRAETSLYDAQQSNVAVMVYQPGRDEGHQRQLSILGDLRRAVANSAADTGELQLYYQPKVDMRTQRVRSMEALVRWTHPKHGRISPAEFVPLAEQAGSISLLTQWVLRTSHRQMSLWRALGVDLDVSINLSAGDLSDPELPQLIRAQVQASEVPAERWVMEITESAVMRDPARAIEVMKELGSLGVRFSIDDFGTGFSSLAQLKRLPVDEIKIDKSFVLELAPKSEDAVIVRSTIELGHNLGVKVVAEGVETAESWRQLLTMGCDLAQGYFISAPLPAKDVAPWVQALNAKLVAAETPTQQVRVLREHRKPQP